MACTRETERIAVSTGNLLKATSKFEKNNDVSNVGVLCALPALLNNGLLKFSEKYFNLPAGFYSLIHIMIILAFMALARIKSLEELKYSPPGEWGKLLGLDRIPEVKTLRNKIKLITENGNVDLWAEELSKNWMKKDPEAAGILYIDGHVNTYYSKNNKLPRRYVTRQRLCLRGLTDYWINDMTGKPFFVVSTPFTNGMLDIMKEEIVPKLKNDVPKQPTAEEMNSDIYLNRFMLIFDREGYSPDFFKAMWKDRISCQTYNKYPKENWDMEEFKEYTVTLAFGEKVKMKLAERGTFIGKKMWVREIRKLADKKHQTSILSTDYKSDITKISCHMFARWSQENFFKYMLQHFNIDRFISYEKCEIDDTQKVINPLYRKLESNIKSKAAILSRRLAKFGKLNLPDIKSKNILNYEIKKAKLNDEIECLQKELEELKEKRKNTEKHIKLSMLPENEKFKLIAPVRKHFIDTVKMIAYRAETALSILMKDIMSKKDNTRTLLRELFTTAGDLIPDKENKILIIKIHHLTNKMSDDAIVKLFDILNETQTIYPGTNLCMKFKLVSD